MLTRCTFRSGAPLPSAGAHDRHLMPILHKETRVLFHHPLDTADYRSRRIVDHRDPHGAGAAFKGNMRIVALIIVVAIVYLLYGENGAKQSAHDRVEEARQEAAQVQPASAPGTPAAASGSLRVPIDRTRQALDLVKTRNTE